MDNVIRAQDEAALSRNEVISTPLAHPVKAEQQKERLRCVRCGKLAKSAKALAPNTRVRCPHCQHVWRYPGETNGGDTQSQDDLAFAACPGKQSEQLRVTTQVRNARNGAAADSEGWDALKSLVGIRGVTRTFLCFGSIAAAPAVLGVLLPNLSQDPRPYKQEPTAGQEPSTHTHHAECCSVTAAHSDWVC